MAVRGLGPPNLDQVIAGSRRAGYLVGPQRLSVGQRVRGEEGIETSGHRCHDEERRVGPVEARLQERVGVQDEVLAEERRADRRPHRR